LFVVNKSFFFLKVPLRKGIPSLVQMMRQFEKKLSFTFLSNYPIMIFPVESFEQIKVFEFSKKDSNMLKIFAKKTLFSLHRGDKCLRVENPNNK